MMETELLDKLKHPSWDYSKEFEWNDELDSYRYKTSILFNPSHFFIGTKKKDRGKGHMRELIRRVMEVHEGRMSTTIEAEDKLNMQKFLIELGMEYDTRCKHWVFKRTPIKWHEDITRWEKRYSKKEWIPSYIGKHKISVRIPHYY